MPAKKYIVTLTKDEKEILKDIINNRICNYGSSSVKPLIIFLEGLNFFSSPASTRFHGCSEGGLWRHSYGVLKKAVSLLDAFKVNQGHDEFSYNLFVACLFHDACKAGLYTVDYRNVKDEKTGQWGKIPYYKIKEDSTACGHGGESLRRIERFVYLPGEWALAVYWHMGSYGLSSDENYQYLAACRNFPEVLLLHTADMLQVCTGGN